MFSTLANGSLHPVDSELDSQEIDHVIFSIGRKRKNFLYVYILYI